LEVESEIVQDPAYLRANGRRPFGERPRKIADEYGAGSRQTFAVSGHRSWPVKDYRSVTNEIEAMVLSPQ
jgi:hypothetical protein